MKCVYKILLFAVALIVMGAFLAPRFVSDGHYFSQNLKYGHPSDEETERIKSEARTQLTNPINKFLLWPGKVVLSERYSLSTYEVNAHTFFGIRFASIQVKCFRGCSSFVKDQPGELEIVYVDDTVTVDGSRYNTDGWLVHQGRHNYQIKYKPGWVVRTAPQEWAPEELHVTPVEFGLGGPIGFITIDVTPGENFDEMKRDIKLGEHIDDPLTPLVFNGKNGYIQNGLYYVYHKDNMYQIRFEPHSEYGLTDEEAMAALSSIEFID